MLLMWRNNNNNIASIFLNVNYYKNLLFSLIFAAILTILVLVILIKMRSNINKDVEWKSLKNYLNEKMEFENLIMKVIDNLELTKSPETALLYTSKAFDNDKINRIVLQNIILGLPVKDIFNNLCNLFHDKESKRILNLLSRSLTHDSMHFIPISKDVLKYIKEINYLKKQLESLLVKVRIRITVLSISSSAILAFLSKIIPFILNLTIESSSAVHSQFFSDLSFITFLLFLTVTFYNTYIISKTVFHSHATLLSAIAALTFIFLYIITPEVVLRF